VREAYAALASQYDIVVIEGAGSPAEINLRDNDIVNMGMAAIADAPVLLVGDIDRGGVFASLYGTVALLEPEERARIRGLVINKFRGDAAILRPGLSQLEELTGVPVVGVVPWLRVDIDDEDSVSPRLDAKRPSRPVDVAVVRLPRLSNFTDFNALERHDAVGVRYVETLRELGRPDLVVIPGSKNTMADLAWMRQNGLETALKRLAKAGVPLVGICGGYQMLGLSLEDPDGVEHGGAMRGMDLLPVRTVFAATKTRTRVAGRVNEVPGFFSCAGGAAFEGYEIHVGTSVLEDGAEPFVTLDAGDGEWPDGAVRGPVAGTYVHGLFDSGDLIAGIARKLLADKGVDFGPTPAFDWRQYKESQYDLLAGALREALDMDAIYSIMGLGSAQK
jgi:adenosylcobyric acid synthase